MIVFKTTPPPFFPVFLTVSASYKHVHKFTQPPSRVGKSVDLIFGVGFTMCHKWMDGYWEKISFEQWREVTIGKRRNNRLAE